VMRCDQAGRMEWITPSVTGLTGWQPAQLVGLLFWDFVHPDDRYSFAAAQGNVMEGTMGQTDLRFRTSQGGYHWVSISLRPVFDATRLVSGYVAGWLDVQKEVQTQEAVALERARLQATLDALLDPHMMLDAVRDPRGQIVDFAITAVNPAACAYKGTTREQLIGRRLLESFPGYKAGGLFDLYRETAESSDPLILNDFAYRDEIHGAGRRLDIRAVRVNGSVSCTWRDVTDRYVAAQRLAQSEEHYRLLTRNAYGTVVRTDAEGTILWVSPSLEGMLGYRPEEWVGRPAMELLEPESAQRVPADLQMVARGDSVVGRYRVKDRQGRCRWVESFASPYVDEDDQVNGVVASFHIVDEQVATEKELERRARTDELTNLLNRKEVLERLDEMSGKQKRLGGHLAVLFCDLDKFKTVNDTHGHKVGDEVLHLTAERLRGCLRTSDDLGARVGGDEMMIVLHGVHDLHDALQVAEKLRGSIAEPMSTSAGPLKVTMSVGVTLAGPGENTASIIARADDAMYQAKKTGRNQVIAIPAVAGTTSS
jgi:diguanylate cyclase (GGDEF)-like protein/PAS domain S-box-containing protein